MKIVHLTKSQAVIARDESRSKGGDAAFVPAKDVDHERNVAEELMSDPTFVEESGRFLPTVLRSIFGCDWTVVIVRKCQDGYSCAICGGRMMGAKGDGTGRVISDYHDPAIRPTEGAVDPWRPKRALLDFHRPSIRIPDWVELPTCESCGEVHR